MGFVIHWHESAMELHVFPIPIPLPTSLSTRFLWVFPVHQARALVWFFQFWNTLPSELRSLRSCLSFLGRYEMPSFPLYFDGGGGTYPDIPQTTGFGNNWCGRPLNLYWLYYFSFSGGIYLTKASNILLLLVYQVHLTCFHQCWRPAWCSMNV